jgi:hypothetical protein
MGDIDKLINRIGLSGRVLLIKGPTGRKEEF